MRISIREDSVEIDGYVNAIERNSKPLNSGVGQFIERICKGAFKKALNRNDDVHILLNHDWNRDLGSTKKGNLELEEDNIGLHARAKITDKDVIEKARNGDLVGWSFGFTDRDVENTVEHNMPTREVRDLDLYEVSILDRTKIPAYDGTLITARAEDKNVQFRDMEDTSKVEEIPKTDEVMEEPKVETPKEDAPKEQTDEQPKQQEIVDKNIDYSLYQNMIKEMKEE